MKNSFKLIPFLVLGLFFSGCTTVSNSNGGFFKSTNGGETFFQEDTESGSILNGKNILSLEINPNNNQEIFVGTSNFGLFKTVDEGKNWLTDVNGFSDVRDIEIVPHTTTIYMVARKDGRGKLFKSDNNGETWIE